MPRRVYVGPIVEVVTALDGVEMTLARGESVDVSDEQAAILDRDEVNWAKPRTFKQKEGES
jgi:hypothetical protein